MVLLGDFAPLYIEFAPLLLGYNPLATLFLPFIWKWKQLMRVDSWHNKGGHWMWWNFAAIIKNHDSMIIKAYEKGPSCPWKQLLKFIGYTLKNPRWAENGSEIFDLLGKYVHSLFYAFKRKWK